MRFGTLEILLLVFTVAGWAVVLAALRRMHNYVAQLRALLPQESHAQPSMAAHPAGQASRVPIAVSPANTQQGTPAQNNAAEAVSVPAAESVPPAAGEDDELSAETLLVIAAAVAAYLGEKVHVRRARLITTGASVWAQQGRVFIQASHNLPRTRF